MVYLLCMSTRIATRQIQLPNRIKLNLVNGDRSAAIETLKFGHRLPRSTLDNRESSGNDRAAKLCSAITDMVSQTPRDRRD